MVGIELEQLSSAARNTADDDVFMVVAAFLVGAHGTPEHINADNRHKVSHSASVRGRDVRMRSVVRDSAFQTANDVRF